MFVNPHAATDPLGSPKPPILSANPQANKNKLRLHARWLHALTFFFFFACHFFRYANWWACLAARRAALYRHGAHIGTLGAIVS
jgi:hypothetical protein